MVERVELGVDSTVTVVMFVVFGSLWLRMVNQRQLRRGGVFSGVLALVLKIVHELQRARAEQQEKDYEADSCETFHGRTS